MITEIEPLYCPNCKDWTGQGHDLNDCYKYRCFQCGKSFTLHESNLALLERMKNIK